MLSSDLLDADLTTRRLRVRVRDVVYVKCIVEASLGVAMMLSEGGGRLMLAASHSRAADLDELAADICSELPEAWVS